MLIAKMHMGVLVFLLFAVPGRARPLEVSISPGLMSNRGSIEHDL